MTFPERRARRATALGTARRQTPQKPVIPAEGSPPTSTERQKQTLRPGRYEEPQDPKIFGLGAAKIIGVQLRGAGVIASGMKSRAGRKRTCDGRPGPKRHWRPSGKAVRGFSLGGIVRLLAVYAAGLQAPACNHPGAGTGNTGAVRTKRSSRFTPRSAFKNQAGRSPMDEQAPIAVRDTSFRGADSATPTDHHSLGLDRTCLCRDRSDK